MPAPRRSVIGHTDPVSRTRRRGFDWWFRDRRGRVVVAQPPNLTLWVWIGATAVRLLFDPSGTLGTTVRVVAVIALLAWALDEIVRGVNPWRRLLGALVFAAQITVVVV